MTSSHDHLVKVTAGDYLFREGELGTEMYIVRSGRVEILKQVLEDDSSDAQLAIFGQGDFFGEVSLLDDQPRSASVRAIEDSELVCINATTFIQMLRDNPEIGVRMMRKLSRRLRHTDRLLQEAIGGRVASESSDRVGDRQPSPGEAVPGFRLVDPTSGLSFDLSPGPETLIGRADPVTGIEPRIDLTPVDSQRSSSRRHAKIYRREGRLFLAEEIGSMNGTFVNGQRLDTGSPVEIAAGDVLRFGVLELELRAD